MVTHRTWARPEAAALAKLYGLVAPNYAAAVESFQKAQEAANKPNRWSSAAQSPIVSAAALSQSTDRITELYTSYHSAQDRIVALAQSDDNKIGLRWQTEQAKVLGSFGSPTFVAGNDLVWARGYAYTFHRLPRAR